MEGIIKSQYKGYERLDFNVNGHEAVLVCPKNPACGNMWIWRTEFFGAFDQADMAMVEKGWYLANYKISDMYGSPKAVKLMKGFYDYMVNSFKLNEKTVPFGFSRGGLYAFNFAAEYPDKILAMYLDAPVLDIKSWPGGMGVARRGEREWRECLEAYGLTEQEAKEYRNNPLDKVQKVAIHRIPIIVVAGGADDIVPFEENAKILVEKYKAAGGRIELILKPECGHHPHSLDDVTPIVNFILNYNANV